MCKNCINDLVDECTCLCEDDDLEVLSFKDVFGYRCKKCGDYIYLEKFAEGV
jgi:hypothetical protein